MTDQTVTRPRTDAARHDEARIAAGISGAGGATDPFVVAVRATHMPMVISNPRLPDNPVVFANAAFCRLTGYDRSEIVGRNCRFLQGPQTDRETIASIRAAVHAARPIEIDIRNHRKNGEPFWNRLMMAPVRDADGEIAYFFASQLDVTLERERMTDLENSNATLIAELAGRLEAQQEREEELRFALDAGRFGAWSLDLATDELKSSSTCRANFGRDPDLPFSHAELHAAVHPDDRARVSEEASRSIATGADYDIDYRVIATDGEVRWVAIRARPSYAADGTPLRLAGVSLDLTGVRRADAMRRALAELGDVFREHGDIADISCEAGRILAQTLELDRAGYGTVDAAAETVTVARDWSAAGVGSLAGTRRFRNYGSYIEDLKHGDTVVIADAGLDPRTAAMIGAFDALDARAMVNMPVIEQGELVALFYLNHRRPREWRDDEIAFLREVAGRTRVAVERRRAEQDLAALAASLERQVIERSGALLAAEAALRHSQKMEAIGQLTGGVAHDFNNLLTVIRSAADFLRLPHLAEEKRRRYVDAISDTADRAARLTSQLLAFARRQSLTPEIFDVAERVDSIAGITRTLTGSRIRIAVEALCDPCFVEADPSQFETAIVNMAVNARDAMDGEGKLTIRVRAADAIPAIRGHAGAAGDYVAVSLEDTGAGIDASRLASIFEPFFTTKPVGKGTGLGLSQVYGFAKQSGGDVHVESAVGRGTTFTMFLPRCDAPPPAPAIVPRAMAGMPEGSARVLVVEDNVEVGEFSTQLLNELGHRTTLARNADEALLLIGRGERFDVVFTDVVMPGMSGVELGKRVQQLRPGLPVVLTSGYSHVIAQEGTHGFELLRKPYSIETLSSVLGHALATSDPA